MPLGQLLAGVRHDPLLTVSYEQYLKFFGFAPFRLRLRCTSLRFVWRIVRSDARLARAVLLGSFSFEQERVRTHWDALLDADLLTIQPVPVSREEWFAHICPYRTRLGRGHRHLFSLLR